MPRIDFRTGLNRLPILIGALVMIPVFFEVVDNRTPPPWWALIVAPVAAGLAASCVSWVLLRLAYWVLRGFFGTDQQSP